MADKHSTSRGTHGPYLDGWSLGPSATAYDASTAGGKRRQSTATLKTPPSEGSVRRVTPAHAANIRPDDTDTSGNTAEAAADAAGTAGGVAAAVAASGVAAAGAAAAGSAVKNAVVNDESNNVPDGTESDQPRHHATASAANASADAGNAVTDRVESVGRNNVSESTLAHQAHSGPAGGRSGGGGLGLLALLLSLLALGAAGYLFYRTQVTQQLETVGVTARMESVKEAVDTAKGGVDKIEGKVDAVKDDLSSYKSTVDQQFSEHRKSVDEQFSSLRNEDLAAINKAHNDSVSRVQAIEGNVQQLSGSLDGVTAKLDRSLGEWQLQEVEQLMRTANDRLTLSGDVEIASAALGFADQRLADMDDPGLVDVRTELADELRALSAIERIDVSGIAARVRALQNGVDSLVLREQVRDVAEEEPASEQAADAVKEEASDDGPAPGWRDASYWKSIGRDVLDDFAGTIKIQKAGEARPALMSPDERFFLYQNLRLMLNSAQLALLQNDEGGFKQNLSTSREWVSTYFVQDDKPVVSMLAELDALGQITIGQDLPDISDSLGALRKVIQARAAQ